MQKTTLAMTIGLVLCLGTSACQPKSEASDNEASQTQSTETPTIQSPKKPLASSESKMAVTAQTCLALNKAMEKIDNTSKIEAIYAVQKQLKACLPTASNAEVLALLKSYQAMYNRFLASDLDSDADYETFNSAIYELYYGDGLSSAQLKTLMPRDQYLVGLIKSDADVSIYDQGEGFFSFTHNLKAMADIFTPYLRPDQSAFIQRMAKDNQDTFWSDASVTTTFAELIERAVFWEDYIQRYPNGYAVKDAKSLLDFYRYVLFYGSDNTQWTDDAIHEFLEPGYRQDLLKLTKRPNSGLAKDAQRFLNFLSLTDSERQSKYPAPDTDEEGYERNEWQVARYQLNEVLQIPSIWGEDADHSRDCLNGVFCQDESAE